MTEGRAARRKGDRIERELVALHYLSGVSRGAGHDLNICALGKEQAPFVAGAKGRKNGAGFVTPDRWLGEYASLFLRRNNADPLVVIPWRPLEKVRP